MSDVETATAETQANLILASRVLRTPVFTVDADRLGHVEDISIDRVSGQSVYGIMSFGGFLGIGEKYHPLPWELLSYEPGVAGFIVPMTRDDLRAAPHYTREEPKALGGPRHHQRDSDVSDFYATYGVLR